MSGRQGALGRAQQRQGHAARRRSGARWKTTAVNVGPVWSRIPNFAGADLAAWHLAQTPEWKAARVVKCNPDPPQIPVRLRALHEGKIVYAPVPELTQGFPFVRLDPEELTAKGIEFETAATVAGLRGSTASRSSSRTWRCSISSSSAASR